MDDDDTTTPRTLISTILEHNVPQKTVRQSARQKSHSIFFYQSKMRKGSNEHQANTSIVTEASPTTLVPSEKDSSATPSEVLKQSSETARLTDSTAEEDGMSLSDVTPRRLMSTILQKHNITKTLRVAVRRVHPQVIQKNLSRDPPTKSICEESNATSMRKDKNTEHEILMSTESDEQLNEHRTEAHQQSPDKLSNAQTTDYVKYKPRTKRLRLSNVEILTATEIPDDSFIEGILSDLKMQVKKKKKNLDLALQKKRKVSEAVQTSLESLPNTSSSVPHNDASSKTAYGHNLEKSAVENGSMNSKIARIMEETEDLVPPSDIDVESQLGPLELSRISEAEHPPDGTTPRTVPIEVHKSHGSFEQDQEYQQKDGDNIRLQFLQDGDSLEITKPSSSNLDQQDSPESGQEYKRKEDSDIWPESMNNIESSGLTKSTGNNSEHQEINNVENEGKEAGDIHLKIKHIDVSPEVEILTSDPTKVKKLPSRKKIIQSPKASTLRKVRRRSRLESNLPLTRSHVFKLTRHFATKKFTRHGLIAVQEMSRRYLAATAKDVEQLSDKLQQKCITLDTVKTLMKRRGVITEKKTLNVLVEENFPLEYRQLLIPIAISGNAVLPKKGTDS